MTIHLKNGYKILYGSCRYNITAAIGDWQDLLSFTVPSTGYLHLTSPEIDPG